METLKLELVGQKYRSRTWDLPLASEVAAVS